MENNFEFYAFLSYKREDEKWAKWLQKRLEKYALPSSISKHNPNLPKRIRPNFRDNTDIQPNPLEAEIKHNLDLSQYLIVIASPHSAKSHWVGFEIQHFIDSGKAGNIILFIIKGEPYSDNPESECYHQVIKNSLPKMLGANINEKGEYNTRTKKNRAVIQVISRMLGVSFDSLWKRQQRRMRKRRIMLFLISLGVVSAIVFTWLINQPFSMQISLKENTAHNEQLPFGDGKLQIILGTEYPLRQLHLAPIHYNH